PNAHALVRHAHEIFDHYIDINQRFSASEIESIKMLRSASRLADVLAAHLITDPMQQQELLETVDPELRLEKLCVNLGNMIEVLELDHRIRQRVREQVDRNQQEYYLKEQIRAIQRELGQDNLSEAQELRDRVAQKQMPAEVETRILKEITRMERTPANSAELGIIRGYIDWALSLPWQERSEDHLDIRQVRRVMDEKQFGLARVKERITEFLAVRQLRLRKQAELGQTDTRALNRGPILCLIGPPGVGKTSLGESIATAMGREFVRISLGGVHDEAEVRGHRRTYVGALPGRIITAMKRAGVKNPVFLLDEIDKLTSDNRGDPSAALLEVLDPSQNNTFTDHYMEVPYDLSEVFFICTGNGRHGIPRALADRMEIIDIPGYTEEEKFLIARDYIWPRTLRENELTLEQIKIPDKVLQWLIPSYTREAGVRALEHQLDAICRKVALRVVHNPDTHIRLTKKIAEEFLGQPRYKVEQLTEGDQVGVAMGMAWTEMGGTLLPVEVAFIPGRGDVHLTGQQGDVMRESAQTAHSYIRTRTKEFGIEDVDFADDRDLHLHLPEGAVPKDGPSAGITIATAMISALTNRPVRADTAMTGEITLRGRVLPIGGLRDKVLAAYRAGIRRIILPAENMNDITDIPERIRSQITFIPAARMEEVVAAALLPTPLDEEGGITIVTNTAPRPPEPPKRPLTPPSDPPPTIQANGKRKK
nr:endopeptidase La [Ktedonobacterales bacterium]